MARTKACDTPEFKAKISRARRQHSDRHPFPPRGTKKCPSCQRGKPYDTENKFASDFTIVNRKRADGTIVKRPYYECKTCRAERMKAKRDAMDAEERRAQARAYYAEYSSKPENREKLRTYSREYDTIQRRKNGVPYKGPWLKYREKDERVPREPFVEWIEQQEMSIPMIAELIGIDERQLRKIVTGREMKNGQWYPIKTVSLDVVDRSLIATGSKVHLRDLYPSLYLT